MTTIEVQRELHAPAGAAPVSAEPVPRRRGGLARRLPYALVALALAAGYAIGHDTNPKAPPPSNGNASVVTPEQINQALAASSGHATPVNDRGYSLLDNGVQHSHGFELPMTQADRKELGRQLDLARATALRFPTLADAQRGGMLRFGPFIPGLGTHMLLPGNGGFAAGDGPMTDEQITHPIAWIYDGTKPTSPVVGLFYRAGVADPAGFVGPNDVWHQHSNICVVIGANGVDAPLGADRDATKAQCDALNGRLITETGPLLHTWVVPGYEDSEGVFAHLNPAVTCDDGTYHEVDLAKVGVRTSACLDGTE